MANKMLIDASHPEETRVVVQRGQRVEEFDFESASKRPLRGNIYLAKVTRVEPSLQAAFVDYGGNRHGFLAFSEIHPDYYQIPVADRQALLAEVAAAVADDDDEEEERRPRRTRRRRGREPERAAKKQASDDESLFEAVDLNAQPGDRTPENAGDGMSDDAHDAHDAHNAHNAHLEGGAATREDFFEKSSDETEPGQAGLDFFAPAPIAQEIGRDAPNFEAARGESFAAIGSMAPPAHESRAGVQDCGPPDLFAEATQDAHAAERLAPEAREAETPSFSREFGHEADSAAAERMFTRAKIVEGDQDVTPIDAPQADAQDGVHEFIDQPRGRAADEDGDREIDDREIGEGEADDGAHHRRRRGRASDDEGREGRHGRHRRNAYKVEARSETDLDIDDDEDEEDDDEEHVEQIGGDALEEMPQRKSRPRRQYKIQEVIKRRQVLLVQVAKEERGTKGAALTTYLSLAGRYSVLMPNTARGGGISRKITDALDRKRMKEIAQDLEVPEGMGVILRTAGASRTRAEVKRDFEYLLRMWETVRETTLRSTAPTLVYEEGSLVKRAIRDLYSKEIDEIVVSGEAGYREARDFMRLLMPSHVRNVRPWREPEALFVRAGVESQLDAMFSSQVTLRSGGYLVINQTEALVAIDVNSGRSTREHNIEDTALRTNLEAADEVARQLRLRDLAGLIVVDFIDMEELRNNRAVERRLKDALKNDRARIQAGRISHFGLLEMSRQRIRAGVLEGSTVPCAHCAGTGMVRSVSSIALHVLRVLEETLNRSASHNIIVKTRAHVAFYILNQKREHLRGIEERYGVEVFVLADETLTGSSYHALERGEPVSGPPKARREFANVIETFEDETVTIEEAPEEDEAAYSEEEPVEDARQARALDSEEDDEADGQRRKRRRRRRRGGRGESEGLIHAEAPQPSDEALGHLTRINEGASARPQWSEPGDGYWAHEDSAQPKSFEAPGAVLPAPNFGPNFEPAFRAPVDAPVGEAVEPCLAENDSDADGTQSEIEPAEARAYFEDLGASSHAAPEHAAPERFAPEHAAAARASWETAPSQAALFENLGSDSPETAPQETSEKPAEPPVAREPFERVITTADPAAPKKGGWWQRAKTSLSGE